MEPESTYYRRRLPHYQSAHGTYFITFRLHSSLPRSVITNLKEEQLLAEQLLLKQLDNPERQKRLDELKKKYFGKFDTLLDSQKTGPLWLRNHAVAGIVADSIHHRDKKQYDLLSYVSCLIMYTWYFLYSRM